MEKSGIRARNVIILLVCISFLSFVIGYSYGFAKGVDWTISKAFSMSKALDFHIESFGFNETLMQQIVEKYQRGIDSLYI